MFRQRDEHPAARVPRRAQRKKSARGSKFSVAMFSRLIDLSATQLIEADAERALDLAAEVGRAPRARSGTATVRGLVASRDEDRIGAVDSIVDGGERRSHAVYATSITCGSAAQPSPAPAAPKSLASPRPRPSRFRNCRYANASRTSERQPATFSNMLFRYREAALAALLGKAMGRRLSAPAGHSIAADTGQFGHLMQSVSPWNSVED